MRKVMPCPLLIAGMYATLLFIKIGVVVCYKTLLICVSSLQNVAIELHGSKGFIGASKLDNAANNFERDKKDGKP